MKIIFVTNYFNHHQKAFSEAMHAKIKDNYHLISTVMMRDERKRLGYVEEYPSYVLRTFDDDKNKKKVLKLIDDADIVIAGSASEKFFVRCKKMNKLIFRYSERPFKVKENIYKKMCICLKYHLKNPKYKSIYMLCASAYTASDFWKMNLFVGKTYKWGYFPETKLYENIDTMIKDKHKKKILWCGRFLKWKHPDDLIEVGERLREEGYDFEINFIGTGVLEETLKQKVKNKDLGKNIHFLGTMRTEQVRSYMEKSGIFLFTSDKQEGWGAVLNESMNSGCAVVASHAIGSVPYLLKNNENGLIYKSGDLEMLYKRVKYLMDNPDEQERLGKAAYKTIVETWNAEVAAKRFVSLAEQIINGNNSPDLYTSGPCSKAEIINDDWFDIHVEALI